MAISLVAHDAAQGTTGGATTAGTDTTGATLLVVALTSFVGAAEPTLSDSYGNTWTPLTAATTGVSRTRFFYAAAPAVGVGHTVTVTGATSFPVVALLAFAGTGGSPFDAESGGTFGTVTTAAAAAVTPAADGAAVVVAFGYEVAGAPGSPALDGGFTVADTLVNVAGTSFGTLTGYLIQTTAALAGPTATWTTASAGTTATAAFAAGGGFDPALLPRPPCPPPASRRVRAVPY